MNGAGESEFSAPQGGEIHVEDLQKNNTLDLSTGKISLINGDGVIENWQLNADLKDLLFRTAVRIALSGTSEINVTMHPHP